MNELNSDDLRGQLRQNNAAMNALADSNEKIVALLSQRGLQAVDTENGDIPMHSCVMQLDKLAYESGIRAMLEPKRREEIALTADELKAGGWWCADISQNAARSFSMIGLPVYHSSQWGNKNTAGHNGCLFGDCSVVRDTDLCDNGLLKQIHRRGNYFYWGAPL